MTLNINDIFIISIFKRLLLINNCTQIRHDLILNMPVNKSVKWMNKKKKKEQNNTP